MAQQGLGLSPSLSFSLQPSYPLPSPAGASVGGDQGKELSWRGQWERWAQRCFRGRCWNQHARRGLILPCPSGDPAAPQGWQCPRRGHWLPAASPGRPWDRRKGSGRSLGARRKAQQSRSVKRKGCISMSAKSGPHKFRAFREKSSPQRMNRLSQPHVAPLSLPGLWKRHCHRLHGVPLEPAQGVGAQQPAVTGFLPSSCTAPCCTHYAHPGVWREVVGGVPTSPQLHPAFLARRCQTKGSGAQAELWQSQAAQLKSRPL